MMTDLELITNLIIDEMVGILGFSKQGFARNFIGRWFETPAARFASIWKQADDAFLRGGIQQSGKFLLQKFTDDLSVRGCEKIPVNGPCIIASNHPGAFDSAAIIANVPRLDLKVIISGIDFLQKLPNLGSSFITAPLGDSHTGMQALRESIHHLQQGGALMIFPSGLVDPDPQMWDNASDDLERWSPSLELFIRKVPDTKIVPTVVSGVVAPKWARHPFTYLAKPGWQRRRMAEFLQIVSQLIGLPTGLSATFLSFGIPLGLDQLQEMDDGILSTIIQNEKNLMAEHLQWINTFQYR